MLNDYGRSLFRPWFSVQNVVLFLGVLFVVLLMIRACSLNSSEVASWVQAFGSIAAIWGAFEVSNRQSRKQEASRIAEDERKAARVKEVLIYFASIHLDKIKKLKNAVQKEYYGGATLAPYLAERLHLDWPDHLEVLKSIDINGLDPFEVSIVIQMRVAAQFALDVCARLEEDWDPVGDREEEDIERLRYFRDTAESNYELLKGSS